MGKKSTALDWIVPAAVVVLLLPTFGEAAYFQAGYDAARTGATPDAGPETDDVAFRVQVSGSPITAGPPLIVGRNVYVAVGDVGLQGLTTNAVLTVNLDTADVATFVPLAKSFQGNPWGQGLVLGPVLASDGERLFVTRDLGMDAYAVTDGRLLWSWSHTRYAPEHMNTECWPPAVRDGIVHVNCIERARGVETPIQGNLTGGFAVIAAVDANSGHAIWEWTVTSSALAQQGSTVPIGTAPGAPSPDITFTWGSSILGPYVLFSTIEQGIAKASLWSLDARRGTLVWAKNNTAQLGQCETSQGSRGHFPYGPAFSTVTGTSAVAYLKWGSDLLAMNTGNGDAIWSSPVRTRDTLPDYGNSGSGFSGDTVYVAGTGTVYAFNTTTHEDKWTPFHLDREANQQWSTEQIHSSTHRLYARSFGLPPQICPPDAPRPPGPPQVNMTTFLYSLDADSGATKWIYPTALRNETNPLGISATWGFNWAVADGLLVLAAADGNVTVLGRTNASIGLDLNASNLFPAIGESLVVDLSRTRAGVQGAPTEFRADWGDGTATEWQGSPLLGHAYSTKSDYRARFQARNAAGQTASEFVTFHPGGAPASSDETGQTEGSGTAAGRDDSGTGPVAASDQGLLERALSQEYQNITFFVLGLLLTLAGAIWGIAAFYRRRRILRRELDAVQSAYERTRGDPTACHAALADREERARALLLKGTLDNGQFAIIERRIGDLTRAIRLASLEDRLDLLPHGMVRTLRQILADGRVTALEREHFFFALERDQLLGADEKERVRRLVEGWFTSDSATAAGTRVTGD